LAPWQAAFQIDVTPLSFRQAKPPAVIPDHDADMVRVIERRASAIGRGTLKVPLRPGDLPDELRTIVAVFFSAGPAAFRSKII
jgi:hypothetical protein